MDKNIKNGVDIKDKAYYARCIRQLKEWGAPLDGWRCVKVIDVKEDGYEIGCFGDLFECELCGCTNVRNVHIMEHDLYFEEVRVGCICAGIMEGDILKAEERERKMKNRARRRKNFIKRKWKEVGYNEWVRTYRHKDLCIRKINDMYYVSAGSAMTRTYKGKPIRDYLSAVYAAFKLADPVEDVL